MPRKKVHSKNGNAYGAIGSFYLKVPITDFVSRVGFTLKKRPRQQRYTPLSGGDNDYLSLRALQRRTVNTKGA